MNLELRRLDGTGTGFAGELDRLLALPRSADDVLGSAAAIVDDVRRRGDAALLEYTGRFDAHHVADAAALEVPPSELQAALATIPMELREALQQAATRIRDFHRCQLQESWSRRDELGCEFGERITPMDRVGLYVPGGKAAYPSSVLMNALPARVAGVEELIMVTPFSGGEANPLVLAAAALAEVDRVFAVGGAQAVAALAYGTAVVPRVDKIVGPGNAYVTAAKRMVFGAVGIDMPAGPSEVLVICDADADPEWVALDLFAQAEHDEDARAVLISDAPRQLDRVADVMQQLLPEMERADIIRVSLQRHGLLIRSRDLPHAASIANRIAPEHLELAVNEPHVLLPHVRHAGAVFLGAHSAEVLGDYCAGPNHVLPTDGAARFASPLGVQDFQKRSSTLHCTPEACRELSAIAACLARGEGLTAHARAAERRRHS